MARRLPLPLPLPLPILGHVNGLDKRAAISVPYGQLRSLARLPARPMVQISVRYEAAEEVHMTLLFRIDKSSLGVSHIGVATPWDD